MLLIDTPSNTKIVYLFVNDFQWTVPLNKEASVGHPKSGRVYRAIKNVDTESYRVIYTIDKIFQGVLIDKLDNNDSAAGYLSDIHEITKSNVLDFDILEEDLTEFVRWLETENKDLITAMEPFFDRQRGGGPQIITKKILPDVVVEILRPRDPELASVIATINELRSLDPQVFVALGAFVNHVLTHTDAETSISDRWIRFDKNLGAGANLSAAITKLSAYGGSDRRTNFLENDLLGAVKDLLLEEYRRKVHEIE